MANSLWLVTAKRNTSNVSAGMSVEILVRNAVRKPLQKEVIDALNMKYGAGTASNGIAMTFFDFVRLD